MAEQKCTFQARTSINFVMLNEIIAREVKHYRHYKNYRPNFNSHPVTCKPYATHEVHEAKSEEELKKFKHYFKKVREMRSVGTWEKLPAAVTENQTYGWFHKPVYDLDRSDRRFYKPRHECDITKTETELLKHTRKDKDKI